MYDNAKIFVREDAFWVAYERVTQSYYPFKQVHPRKFVLFVVEAVLRMRSCDLKQPSEVPECEGRMRFALWPPRRRLRLVGTRSSTAQGASLLAAQLAVCTVSSRLCSLISGFCHSSVGQNSAAVRCLVEEGFVPSRDAKEISSRFTLVSAGR